MFECDCAHNGTLCSQLFSVNVFPTFVKFIGDQSLKYNVKRTYEGIKSTVESLKNINLSFKCLTYPEYFSNYPMILLESPTPDESCTLIQSVIKSLPSSISKRFYYRKSDRESIQGYLGEHKIVPFTSSKIDIESVREFVQDIGIEQFGTWDLSVLKKSQRRGAFIIAQSVWMVNEFKYNSEQLINRFLFVSTSLDTFSKTFPSIQLDRSYFPIFGILNSNKTKFVLLRNVQREELWSFLDKVEQNQYESLMTLDFQHFVNNTVSNEKLSNISTLNDIPQISDLLPEDIPDDAENITQNTIEVEKAQNSESISQKIDLKKFNEKLQKGFNNIYQNQTITQRSENSEKFEDINEEKSSSNSFRVFLIVFSCLIFIAGCAIISIFFYVRTRKSLKLKE